MQRLIFDEKRYNYGNVKRWTESKRRTAGSAIDIFQLDKIFVPICINNNSNHWTLAIIQMQSKIITYYDSLHDRRSEYTKHLLHWIKDEAWNKKQISNYDVHDWRLVDEIDTPRQTNSFDCGVFVIMCADYMFHEVPLSFTQADM